MPADDNSRFLILHDLVFRAKRDRGAPLRLIREVGEENDVKQVLEQAFRSGKAELKIKDEDSIELARLSFREDQGIAILLLQRGNPKGVTPMFKHVRTREIRRSDRTPDDLLAHSCHVVIKIEPENATLPTHRVVVEETTGISPTYIASFFRNVLKSAPYKSNDKRGKEIEAVSTSDFRGHPSESVEEAMHDGTIREIRLVKPGELRDYDDEHIDVRDVIQPLKVKGTPNVVMRTIRDLWTRNRANWTEMRVQIESAEGKSRVVHVGREQDAAQALFVKSEYVTLDQEIDACCDQIHEELVTKARTVLGL